MCAVLSTPAYAGDRERGGEDTGVTDALAARLDRAVRAHGSDAKLQDATPTRIRIVLHVLSGPGGEGDIDDATIASQMAALDAAYADAGFRFDLAQVRRHRDSPYFAGGCFPTTESGLRMKSELAVEPARFVNVYTCRLAPPFLVGYGTLPNEFAEDDARHGIVLDYGTLPGGTPPTDLGHTLVHEMGHYLGLLHTFQGGCADPGDDVADTPAEAGPAFGCPVGRDTCASAGADPVANYMDYSDDACTSTFTPLQAQRMRALAAALRPRLVDATFAIGPGITGNWYDAAQPGHGFSVEVLDDGRMLVEWFVFGPDGGADWIIATGPYAGNRAVLPAWRQVGPGGRFPPRFDATRVQPQPWGTLTLEFGDCGNAQVSWQSTDPRYGAGALSLTRLTKPAGISCP